jgi:penicillin-binding protein 1C
MNVQGQRCGGRLPATCWVFRLVAAGALLMALFLLLDCVFPLRLPEQQGRNFAQLVVDARGRPLRAFADADGVWRYPVTPDEISPLYLTALLTYEDRWFYYHPGINPPALLRALAQRLVHGRIVSGGSTLSMQVARIMHPQSRSFFGKAHQIFRALQLEYRFSKKEILGFYINYAPFGGTVEGVQAASYAYLGKSAAHLSHGEAALLAVLPQRPSALRPDRYPEQARRARDKVLERMARTGNWTAQEIAEARQEPVLSRFEARPMLAPLLAQRMREAHCQRPVIVTTLDAGLQAGAQSLVSDAIGQFPARTSAAVLILDTGDLSVQAYIGSARFGDDDRAGYVDMIQAVRSPGSTLKPFIYGLALDEGLVHAESLLLDVPMAFEGYRPQNFDSGFSGPVSLSEALQRSLNVPAVQVLAELGPTRCYTRLRHAGLDLHLPPHGQPNLSLALGGAGVRLEQLAGIYAALGRGGAAAQPRYTFDQPLLERRLMSAEAAWIIHHNLRAPLQPSGELYRHSRSTMPAIAHKTGTSFGFRDAWAVAVTTRYTVAVWVGRPDGSALPHNSGRISAVPLLRRLLHLLPAEGWHSPPRPSRVTAAVICWPQGTQAQWTPPETCHRRRTAWLIDRTAPPTLRDPHQVSGESLHQMIRVSAQGRYYLPAGCDMPDAETRLLQLWPPSLEPWLPERWQRDAQWPAPDPRCATTLAIPHGRLRLEGIHPGAELSPRHGRSQLPDLTLTAAGAQGQVHWFLNGSWLGETAPDSSSKHRWVLTALGPGEQHVTVMDQAGKSERVRFRVVAPENTRSGHNPGE